MREMERVTPLSTTHHAVDAATNTLFAITVAVLCWAIPPTHDPAVEESGFRSAGRVVAFGGSKLDVWFLALAWFGMSIFFGVLRYLIWSTSIRVHATEYRYRRKGFFYWTLLLIRIQTLLFGIGFLLCAQILLGVQRTSIVLVGVGLFVGFVVFSLMLPELASSTGSGRQRPGRRCCVSLFSSVRIKELHTKQKKGTFTQFVGGLALVSSVFVFALEVVSVVNKFHTVSEWVLGLYCVDIILNALEVGNSHVHLGGKPIVPVIPDIANSMVKRAHVLLLVRALLMFGLVFVTIWIEPVGASLAHPDTTRWLHVQGTV